MTLAYIPFLFFGGLESPTTLIIILVVVLLMFGGKKIPELMHGLGKGVKEFKDAQNAPKETKEEEKPKV
jgi:sec-independent protein translocase protein TatA